MDTVSDVLVVVAVVLGVAGLVAAGWERGWIPGTAAWRLRRIVKRAAACLENTRTLRVPQQSRR
jgi:hypothetical protein